MSEDEPWTLEDLAGATSSLDGPASLTLAQLVYKFGWDHAVEIVKAAAGQMPTRRYCREVLGRMRFNRMWREHVAGGGTRETFRVAPAARRCKVHPRTIFRLLKAAKIP